MPRPKDSSALGPAVFLGLSLFTLATAGPPPDPGNPADRMDMVSAARAPGLHIAAGPLALPPLPRTTPVARSPRPRRLAHILVGLHTETLAMPLIDPAAFELPARLAAHTRLKTPQLARPVPPPLPVRHPADIQLILTGDFVHLRIAPNASAPFHRLIRKGALALQIENRGNWTRVFFPDHVPSLTGWMYSIYLEHAVNLP